MNERFRRNKKSLFVSMILAMMLAMILTTTAMAAPKLSATKLYLVKGQTKTLKVKNTSKKVKWSSTKKTVAKVSSKGKITALKKGTAYIKAKVGSKTLKCTVKVYEPKLASTSMTLTVGETQKLGVSGTVSKLTKKFSSTNTAVASVDNAGNITAKAAGTATIKVKINTKTYKCDVTVKKAAAQDPDTPTPPEDPSEPEQELRPGFDLFPTGFTSSDYSVSYTTVNRRVEFKINKSVITPEELEAQGYTISEDRSTASKDNTLAKATYTFRKLPGTLEEYKKFNMGSNVRTVNGVTLDFGMLSPMVATILAIHQYDTSCTRYYCEKNPVCDLIDYINGPNIAVNNLNRQFIYEQISSHPDVQNAWFNGATPANGYKPAQPFSITVEEGPYYIPAKTTINGYRPETHMVFVYSPADDEGRYMDVYRSSDEFQNWYVYDDNYKHLLASVKPAQTAW